LKYDPRKMLEMVTLSRCRMKRHAQTLSLPIKSGCEMADLLLDDGFDVEALHESLSHDDVRFQVFLCHRDGAISTVSITTASWETDASVTVTTCRNLLWFWLRPKDRRLVDTVARTLARSSAKT
jgi:hypothetical protein